jgi:hypothetical protein
MATSRSAVPKKPLDDAAMRTCDAFADRIFTRVAGTRLSDVAFSVGIAYHNEYPKHKYGAPLISVGTDSDRRRLRDDPTRTARREEVLALARKRGLGPKIRGADVYENEVRKEYWNPAAYNSAELESLWRADTKMDAAGHLLAAQQKKNLGEAFWRAFFVEVAKRLTSCDWSSILKATDEFAVFATDLELVDLPLNLQISVPWEKRKLLFEQGWLPADALGGP